MEGLLNLLVGAVVDTDQAIERFATCARHKFEGGSSLVVLHNLGILFVLDGTVAHGLHREFFALDLVQSQRHQIDRDLGEYLHTELLEVRCRVFGEIVPQRLDIESVLSFATVLVHKVFFLDAQVNLEIGGYR